MQVKIYVVDFNLYSAILDTFKTDLIKLFGGLTEFSNIKGYWLNGENKLISDNVNIWEIYTETEIFNLREEKFKEIVRSIKAITAQEVQLYTVNNEANFIS